MIQTPTPQTDFWADAEVVSTYTRAQAMEDGTLVDLNAAAPDVCAQHYKFPIACTIAVWRMIENAVENGADVPGTVHDLLWMSRVYVVARISTSTIIFECLLCGDAEAFRFKMHCGPGDTPEPVLTLMLPSED